MDDAVFRAGVHEVPCVHGRAVVHVARDVAAREVKAAACAVARELLKKGDAA